MESIAERLIKGLTEFKEYLQGGGRLDDHPGLRTLPKAPSVRDLAKKHGIDLSRVKDEQEDIDLETGKPNDEVNDE